LNKNSISLFRERYFFNSNAIVAFFIGMLFSLTQFCYFFILEAYISSRSSIYFIGLFFWLIGFLIGLQLKSFNLLLKLLFASLIAYYITLYFNILIPFEKISIVVSGTCILISGIAPGYYFVFAKKNFPKIKYLFLHENNGFILGIILSFGGVYYFGNFMLYFSPFVSFIIVCVFYLFSIKELVKL